MSEQKPKKDLRARLGRTISPQTPGAPPIAAPGGIVPPAATPAAPAAAPAAATPAAAAPAAAAPAVVAPPVIAPPVAAAKTPFGTDIAPPPFAKPAEPAKPEKKPRVDPFAQAAVVPQTVRIAVDDKPVDDSEVGRRSGGRIFLVLGVSLLAGAALGAGAGATNERNVLYNTVVTDGHEVYDAVDQASHVVLDAQTHVEALATAAGGGPSGHPSVDYTELTALAAMPNPLQASHFSDRHYHLFQAGAQDDLFTYYNNIQLLWDQFHRLAEIASGPAERPTVDQIAATGVCVTGLPPDQATARAAMDEAANATTTAASAQYVGALSLGPDGTPRAALRFAEAEVDASGAQTGHIAARATPTDAPVPLEYWTPTTALTATPTHAMLINTANSTGVLSERLGAFREYVSALQETRTLMGTTIEVQGRLTTSLGDIARLEPTFAF